MKPVIAILTTLLATGFLRAQHWTGPYQLTTDTAQDVRPAVPREWTIPHKTCLVWQSNRNGTWDLYSRFYSLSTPAAWGPEVPVSTTDWEEVNPAIAIYDTGATLPGFWCIHERQISPAMSRVYAAYYDEAGGWHDTIHVGIAAYDLDDYADPSAIVIYGTSRDTTWVVWRGRDVMDYAIWSAYHDGRRWTTQAVIFHDAVVFRHARIGRGSLRGAPGVRFPVLVYEHEGDVYCSMYRDRTWSPPQAIAPDPGWDAEPEILSAGGPLEFPTWIVWQSDRQGDTAIYITALDSLGSATRLSDPGAGVNCNPSGTAVDFPTDDVRPFSVVWLSDRDGNLNPYSSDFFTSGPDLWVDRDAALDSNPVVSALDETRLWCCWQSTRTGNSDIWGSIVEGTGALEGNLSPRTPHSPLLARPNPSTGLIRLSLPTPAKSIRLHSSTGRLLQTFPGTQSTLDLRALPDGIYFLTTAPSRATRVTIKH